MNAIDHALALITSFVALHGLVPDEARMTMPLPSVAYTSQVVSVAYYLGEPFPPANRDARRIAFPFIEVTVSLPAGVISHRALQPADFGVAIPADGFVGDLRQLKSLSVADLMTARARAYGLLATVLDRRWLIDPVPIDHDQMAVASELSTLLPMLEEKPLDPYYAVAGRDLRGWISRARLHR